MEQMSEERENELVKQAKAGNTKAFGELEKQYRFLAFKVAKGILAEVAGAAASVEAEDVEQDAFEYAFERICDYKPGRFYRWLWSITKNFAMRRRRQLAKELVRCVEFTEDIEGEDYREGWDSQPSEVGAMTAYLDPARWDGDVEDQRVIWVRGLMRSLPWQQRRDLEAYVAGDTPREIAEATERKVGTVKKSIARAKARVLCECPRF